jgi:hypothetical protein
VKTPIVIPAEIRAEIKQHVAEQEPGREACGRVVIRDDDGHAIEYHRVLNGAKRPHTAVFVTSWKPEPGRTSILIHSHERGMSTEPSPGDLLWATDPEHGRATYRSTFGLVVDDGYGLRVRVFRANVDDRQSYEELRVLNEILSIP